MDDEEFLRHFKNWEANLNKKEELDYSKYDALTALYLEATPEQRLRLLDSLARYNTPPHHEPTSKLKLTTYEELLGELTVYMRRTSKRLKTPSDVYALRLGLAAGAIVGEGLDNRDVNVSLAFLYSAAKAAGIDPATHFEEVAETARSEAKKLLLDFLNRDEAKMSSELDLDYFYSVQDELDLPHKETDLR